MAGEHEINVAVAFRDKLIQEFGFTEGNISLTLESLKQTPHNKDLTDCLKVASKSGKGTPGRPDLIGDNIPHHSKLIFLVEVKPTKKGHQGPHHIQIPNIIERQKQYPKEIVDFAVDGVHWYMHACREKFSIIGLAVSGTKEEVENDSYSFSAFFQRQSKPDENDELKHYDAVPLTYNNPAQSPVNNLISLAEFLDAAKYNPQYLVNAEKSIEDTREDLKSITDRYKANLERALTFSSLLVALQDETCRTTLLEIEDKEARLTSILDAYERRMTLNGLPEEEAAAEEEAQIVGPGGGEEE